MHTKRFDIIFEKHIGFGIRWDNNWYPLQLSFAFPFITLIIGFGKEK